MLNKTDILKLIPHRDPFLWVDAVAAWEKNKTISTHKFFDADEKIFTGHFPNHPIVPGVIVLEALAQTSALLVNLSTQQTAATTNFLFLGVKEARFRAPVLPNTRLELQVNMVSHRLGIYHFEGHAQVAGKLFAEAVFSAKQVVI